MESVFVVEDFRISTSGSVYRRQTKLLGSLFDIEALVRGFEKPSVGGVRCANHLDQNTKGDSKIWANERKTFQMDA